MRVASRTILILLPLIFFITQCSKNTSDPELTQEVDQEGYYTEAVQLGTEIDDLEEVALTGSTDQIERYLRRALRKLDRLLDRVRFVVRRHDNEDAKALYEQARDAQKSAIDSAQAGKFEQAFDYVKESRYFALEALKLIKEDIQEHREEIIQHLQEGIEEVEVLLVQISEALAGEENERVEKIYNKASFHHDAAKRTLEHGRLRRARFHLREARWLAHLALRILDDEGSTQ